MLPVIDQIFSRGGYFARFLSSATLRALYAFTRFNGQEIPKHISMIVSNMGDTAQFLCQQDFVGTV